MHILTHGEKMRRTKQIISFILALTLLFTAVPFAYSAEDINEHSNSDTECEAGGRYFFLDEDSLIYAGLPGETERDYITSFAVDSLASYGGKIYACADNVIYEINPDTAQSRPVTAVSDRIEDYALWNGGLYILSHGDIAEYKLSGGEKEIITGKSITSMWFDGAALLSYMTDGELIYTLNLETGETVSDVNFASAFIGDIPVIIHEGEGVSPDTIGFSSLQSKFPAGMYWNHMGSSSNNPNTVTSKPCNHSAYGTTYCNRPTFWSSCQCHGYALQCGYDVVGSNPMNWTKYTSSSAIDNVRAGDVIRLTYTNNLHTIYVLAVSGDKVVFTDCNSYGTCNIRWGATKTKSTLKSQFNYLLKCPVYLSDYFPGGGGVVEYTIKFDLNDAQGKSAASCSETSRRITDGEEYGELPVPVREGYNFLGWYTSASGGTQVSASTTAGTNATVYAHWQIKVYTVSYNANAGGENITNIPASQTKEHFDSLTLNITSRTLYRANYDFNYWNTAPDGSGTQYDRNNYIYTPNESATLYAQWTGQPRSLYFDARGGSISPSYINVRYGDPYGELPVPVRDGYRFAGWEDSNGNPVDSSTVMTSSTTVRIYAKWTEQTYNIIYDANSGADAVSDMPANQSKPYTQPVKLSSATPSRYGYIFNGWNTKPDGSGITYKGGTNYQTNADLTLYAQWKGMEVRVSFDSNGGTNVNQVITLTYGSPYGQLPEPTQTGKDLTGWYPSRDKPTDKPVTAESIVDKVNDFTLYARWDTARYKITYLPNNTSVTNMPANSVRLYGQSGFALGAEIPKRTGFTFKEWNTDENGNGASYAPGQAYDGNSPLTLYAIWERDKYAVVYEANSGSYPPGNSYKYYDIPYSISDVIPEKTGYEFTEWNTAPDGSGVTYFAGDTYTKNEPVTLYAIWNPETYTVGFDAMGGKCSVKSRGYTYDSTYELPAVTRKGYTFDGWFTQETGGFRIADGSKVSITSDCTFFAHWTANTYNAAFNPGQGSCTVRSKQFTYGMPFGEMPEAKKSGAVFAGWFADEEYTQRIEADTVMKYDSDITLYAAFVEKTVTVTFDANGGSVDEGSKAVACGKKYGELPVPSKSGYAFGGWLDGNNAVNSDTVVTNETNHTLKAKWIGDTHTVTLKNGNDVYDTLTVTYGSVYGNLPQPSAQNKTFCGWFDTNGNEIKADTVCTADSDTEIHAVFIDNASDKLVFVADGIIIAEIPVAPSIDEPDVPGKAGYTGEWETYNPETAEVIKAVYTPKEYTLTFKAGNNIKSKAFRYGEKITVPEGIAPEEKTITGWNPELPVTMPAENLTVTALAENALYVANFIAQGRSAGKVSYTLDDTDIAEPTVTAKTGYSGSWEDYTLRAGGMDIFAVYTPVVYTANLVADGVSAGSVTYTVEDEELILPPVPEKTGYEGEWGEYEIVPHSITVNAVYKPRTYYVTFKTAENDTTIAVVPYLYGAKSIKEPAVPEKQGYTGSWMPYTLGAADTVCFAEYGLRTYYATFMSLGEVVERVPFNINTKSIVPPRVPVKKGVSGKWESFSISYEDFTVNAVYNFPEISIKNYTPERKEAYKTTITFTPAVKNRVTNGRVHWIINGEDKATGGTGYTVEKATETFTVQVKYFVGNEEVAASEIETVKIDTGFFAKIVAFFRTIFRRLPDIKQ